MRLLLYFSKLLYSWFFLSLLSLPLLLSIFTWSCSAAFGSLFPSILFTCPNHVSLLLLIFSITVSSAPSSSLVFSFLILFLFCFYLGFFSTTLFLPPVGLVFFHLPSSVSSTPIHKVRLGAPVSNIASFYSLE